MEQQRELIAAARAKTVKALSFYAGGSCDTAELQAGFCVSPRLCTATDTQWCTAPISGIAGHHVRRHTLMC